jgi:hypothetical protein
MSIQAYLSVSFIYKKKFNLVTFWLLRMLDIFQVLQIQCMHLCLYKIECIVELNGRFFE